MRRPELESPVDVPSSLAEPSKNFFACTPNVIVLSVSWLWISWFNEARVRLERQDPLSRWCRNADGDVKRALHLELATHFKLLKGRWTTDSKCCLRLLRSGKSRSQSLHLRESSSEVVIDRSGGPWIFLSFRCCSRACSVAKSRSHSTQRNCETWMVDRMCCE